MSRTRAYRCLNCLEHTVDREFDTSHLSVTCPNCESFERFVNEAVFRQFEAYESSPPAEFDWNRLDRVEKLTVAERLVRSTKTLDDFAIVEGEAAESDGDSAEAAADGAVAEAEGEGSETLAEGSDETVADDERARLEETSEESASGAVRKGTGGETA